MKTRTFDRIGKRIDFTELGFGCAPLGNLYRAISEEDAHDVLEAAWQAGCRYFDTAPLYGLGLPETRLNRFLRGKKRDEYVLSTKVGRWLRVCPPEQRTDIGVFFDTPTREGVYDYTYDGVMRCIDQSLERLGVDRIDILFVHDLDAVKHGSQAGLDARMQELMGSGYNALLSLRDQGVIKAFGAGINEWQPCQGWPSAAISTSSCSQGATRCWSRRRWRRSCRSARSAVSASSSAGLTIPASSPPARSPAPSTITRPLRRTCSTGLHASRPFASDMA
jgi:aryl-alcohol dehydrogenase-like predicted oxidoreductase